MKKNNQNIKDLLFLILLVISFFFLINPLGIIMTTDFEMALLALVSLVVISVLIIAWKENPIDEREETHLLIASRLSFFASAIILLVAIIVQTLQHRIDVWIPIVLFVHLSSKIFAIFYLKYKK